jgi:hypothetical protein
MELVVIDMDDQSEEPVSTTTHLHDGVGEEVALDEVIELIQKHYRADFKA